MLYLPEDRLDIVELGAIGRQVVQVDALGPEFGKGSLDERVAVEGEPSCREGLAAPGAVARVQPFFFCLCLGLFMAWGALQSFQAWYNGLPWFA